MDEHNFTINFHGKEIPSFYVKRPTRAEAIVKKLMEYDCLFGIDTETEGLPEWKEGYEAALSPHLGKIRLVQVYNDKSSVIFDMKFIQDWDILKPFLESKKFIAHNAIFDLMFFMRAGIKNMNIGCTYLLFKTIIHAQRPFDTTTTKASLENVVQLIFKERILKEMQTSDWSEPDLTFEQIEYSAYDPVCVLEIAKKLAPQITRYGIGEYYRLCKNAQHPLARLQLNGIGVDVPCHLTLAEEWKVQGWKAKEDVLKLTGLSRLTPHSLAEWLEENLPKDTLLIWPRTDEGKLQTDAHAFADFDFLDIVKPFSVFQKYYKLVNSFGRKLIEQINPVTSRLHARYNICGARTGRLSCSNPNLQQLPRDKRVRANFIPREGWKFVCADYSQIELRVAAELSQDAEMLKAYRDGIDLHALTASKVSRKPLHEVTKSDRQHAKAVNFGFLFGLGAKKFTHYAKKSYGVTVSPEDAFEAICTFRDTYEGYYEWQMNQAKVAEDTLHVRTPYGKLRRLDAKNTYGTSMNTPVQGGAAECMLHSIVILNEHLKRNSLKAEFVNCVHDELLLECPPNEADILKDLIQISMRDGFLEVFPNGIVRGIAEVGVGSTWAEAKL